ncbi:hypothetical protein JCM6882_006029 [Rhodosporidiobolus microsporus]
MWNPFDPDHRRAHPPINDVFEEHTLPKTIPLRRAMTALNWGRLPSRFSPAFNPLEHRQDFLAGIYMANGPGRENKVYPISKKNLAGFLNDGKPEPVNRILRAVAERAVQDGYQENHHIQVAVVTHGFHPSTTPGKDNDPFVHMNAVFCFVREEVHHGHKVPRVYVQIWKDLTGGKPNTFILHVYDNDEHRAAAPSQWVPSHIEPLSEASVAHLGLKPVPLWEAEEAWDETKAKGAQSFEDLVRELVARFQSGQ